MLSLCDLSSVSLHLLCHPSELTGVRTQTISCKSLSLNTNLTVDSHTVPCSDLSDCGGVERPHLLDAHGLKVPDIKDEVAFLNGAVLSSLNELLKEKVLKTFALFFAEVS